MTHLLRKVLIVDVGVIQVDVGVIQVDVGVIQGDEKAFTVRFNYRLRVSSVMEEKLASEWDNVRFVWNRRVEESINAHTSSTPENKVTCGPAELDKRLTAWHAEHEWLGLGSSVVQQQTIRDFGKARSKALKDIKDRLPMKQRPVLPRCNDGAFQGATTGPTEGKARARALPTLQYTKRGFSLKEGENGRIRLHLAGGIVVHQSCNSERQELCGHDGRQGRFRPCWR